MKGVIKNMKEQFLNLSGLTELVTYIKLCIAQHKMIIPRASFSLFPKTGDENNIYIDTSTNSIYRWNDSDKSFVLLAKPPRNISISEGKNNGQITLKVDEIESNATVHGLKSAAFSNASSFATSAQGAKADSAIQSITIAPGTNNGTVKITVNGVTTDNIKVAGLGSAAFSDIAVFAPAKHTHSKSDVGLGNVDNTADIDKSVKYAGSSGSSNTVVYTALTNTDLNTLQTEGKWYYAGGGNTCTNVPVESAAFELYVGRNASGWRYQQFTVTSGEIYIRVFDSSNWGNWRKLAFTSDTVTAASSVPWSGITGKPSTFAPSSHNHTIANITDIGKASVNFANSAGCPQGFSSRTTTATWGNQTGTVVTDWHTSNGGDIAFRDNSGQLNVVIDGFFYQNEGKNLVLDSGNYSNYAATKIHTHTISNITNLQTTLDGKSNTNHTHDLNQMINTLTNGTSDPADTDYYIAQYAGGGSTTTTYHRRPHSALWNYIKSKANSVYQPKGSYAASSHTHDDRYYTESEINTKLASKSDTSHTHNYVVGSYTGNGGQQKPNYFGTNKVGFLMMNTTVNGDSNYKDWIIMDCYGGNDVGGSVALGVNRQKLAAYIMRSAAERSSWAESAELLHTLNYTSYTVTKTGSGASGTWGINITGSSGSCTGNAATASNASKVNGHTVNSDVPSGAKFTDTNTWRPLGTAANTACAGNDSRLSNSRPASDVYSWAKASSKPSYSWSEITSKPSTFTPASHTHDDRYYTETEINTKLGAKLGAVSANGYYGMARPDGNTSDWIRTTTVGIIPYQSGGAGGGHCGLGTSSWYFSNAYIDTVNCVNASVSGHIDVGGYIQSSNLINTYFEYQSNRGSVDWRFGAATGTGDENFFGFYDAKTGKIPLALDGNYGNIYVGFNVGSYESPTAVGVYLGGQVAGNRAFIYNGDSYQGSIWIQTRLDGSWKWFSLGRACSTALSDIRLKGNIRDTEVEDATKVIESMKIRSFERKDSHKKYKIGFIADELEQLDPNLVDGGGEVDGHPYYKSVNNLQMLAYVVKGMQELNSKVTILEKENKRLKQKLNMCN